MHEAMKKFFDTHRETTAQHRRRIDDSVLPINEIIHDVTSHVQLLQRQLDAAELEQHDPALDGKYQWMHTRLDAAMTRVMAFRKAGRELSAVLSELDAGFAEDQINIAEVLSRKSSS